MTRTGRVGERRTVATRVGDVAVWERGEGPELLLLHGVVANADLWGEVVEDLATDHRCVSVDLPLGAHDLPADPSVPLDVRTLAGAVADVVETTCSGPPVVVANDTGGAVAQLLATEHPEAYRAIVLTSCDTFRNFLPLSLRYLQGLARVPGGVWLMVQALRVPLVRRLPIAFGWLTRRPIEAPLVASFLEPSRRSADVRADLGRVLRAISGRLLDANSADLASVSRPILLLWADTRRVFPMSHGRRLEALVPTARLVPVADSAAFVPLDQPRVVVDEVRSFVTDLPEEES